MEPDTMTHRYRRYARRVGIASSLKELRLYSATQLLAAGTDLNTVAGRLGHAEGSTTLKFYAQPSGIASDGRETAGHQVSARAELVQVPAGTGLLTCAGLLTLPLDA
jgi:integrase